MERRSFLWSLPLVGALLLATPTYAQIQDSAIVRVPSLGAAAAGGGGSGGVSECSGDQDAFGVCLDATTGEIVWEGATADGFEARLSFTDPTVDGSLIFNTNSLTAARTLTVPDSDGILAYRNVNNSFSVSQTFAGGAPALLITGAGGGKIFDNADFAWGTSDDAGLQYDTANTPDTMRMQTSTDSNSWQLVEKADRNAALNNGPCSTGACTNPSLGIFSNDATSSLKWLYLWHDETNARIGSGTGGLLGYRYPVEVVTTTKTPASTTDQTDEGCELYTNTGDADGSTITLPNDPIIGSCYVVAVVEAQTVTVIPNTNELLYTPGDQCAVDITSATQGAILEFIAVTGGDGATWFTKGDVTGWACNDT